MSLTNPIAALSSTRIKVGVALVGPLLFRVILALPSVKHWAVDVSGMDEATFLEILNWLFAAGSAAGGGYVITKRVQDGNNPQNPLPPILPTDAAVKRVTGDVPKPPTSSE